MTTREWHRLIAPVIKHVSTDKDLPELHAVRLELGAQALYAIATDRYTLAAERHVLDPADRYGAPYPVVVHLDAKELDASLKLFTFSKDSDPTLSVTIDETSVPISVAGEPGSVHRLAVTVQQIGEGTRLVLHDHRDPSRDGLAKWRKQLYQAMTRPHGRVLEGLALSAMLMGRWASAAAPGERLTVYSGAKPGDPLLITVEHRFAGLWVVQQYLEGPRKTLAELPWRGELEPDDPALAAAWRGPVDDRDDDDADDEDLDDDG